MGLEPVYAAPEPGIIPTTGDVTYDRISTELKYGDATSSTDIRELTVGGVTIGGTGGISGKIIAKNIVGIKNTGESTPSDISINGATFANGGAITATSLKLNGMDDVVAAINSKAALSDVQNNTNNIADLKNNKANKTEVYTKIESDGKFAGKDYEGKVDALETTVNDASTGLDAANGKITALEGKPTGISYDSAAGTTVNDVTFNAGAVSGVKSINDKIKISDDGSVTINENATNNPVTINSKGIKVGNNSAVVSEDGFKTSGDLYVGTKTSPTEDAIDARFYVKGADGSIKAADGKFTVDDKGNVVSQGSVTAKGGLNVANGNFTVDGTTGNTIVGGTLGVTGNITGADITATGALKGQTLGIGGTGNDKFKVDADGAVKAAGGKVEIDNTGKATFGNIAGNITTIEGKQINTGSIVATDTTVESTISGVKMLNGKITASSMEIIGAISLNDLTVNNKLTVGAFSVDNTGVVTGVKSINGANVTASGTGLTIGSATVGAANPFSSNGFTVDATGNITAGTYNGNTIGADNKFNGVELKSGDVKAKKVTADTITDGTATMTGGTVTANAITANTSASLAGVTFDASGVDFNNKEIKNIAKVTATTADLGNLHIEGANITNRVDPTGGAIGLGTTVTVNNAGELGGIKKIDGVSVGAVTGNGLQFGGDAVIGATGKPFSSTGFEVDGAGNVTGKSFKVNGSNYLDSTGLTTEKAVIGGVNTLNDKGIDTSKNLHVGG